MDLQFLVAFLLFKRGERGAKSVDSSGLVGTTVEIGGAPYILPNHEKISSGARKKNTLKPESV